MAYVTPISPTGDNLPAGVTYDVNTGIAFYQGQPIPARSVEGVQQVVQAINSRRSVTFQDYDPARGAITRTYDPVRRTTSTGPANSTTQVTPSTVNNPTQGNPGNQTNPPNPQGSSAQPPAPVLPVAETTITDTGGLGLDEFGTPIPRIIPVSPPAITEQAIPPIRVTTEPAIILDTTPPEILPFNINPGTVPLDDPEAGEYEARQFLLDRQPVESFAPPPVSDDNLAFEPTFDDGAAFFTPTPPRDDPNAGEFEAQQFVTGTQLRAAPQPITVIDPETGLPVETLESIEARQQFAAQETGVSPYGEEDDPQELPADTDTTVEDTEGYIVPDGTINVPPDGQLLRQPTALGGNFSAQFDPETQSWGIFDDDTGEFIQTGIADEAEAIVLAQEYSIGDPNFAGNVDAAGEDPGLTPEQQQQQAAAQAAADEQARQKALLAQLRQQATIQEQRKQANEGDWRVKLRLAEKAQYLFLDPEIQQGSILWPLLETGGIIFPYTPIITTSYNANYNNYDLTHSNYRGYFYQNSYVGEVNIQATFTAQDTKEAEYLLAVIHFFRSVTKMFYGGKDAFRGAPPPLVFLQGLGEFQFNLHPCLVQSFNYNLPNDVDYIRARSPNINGTNLQIKRQRDILPTSPFSASSARMSAAGVNKGAEQFSPAPPTLGTKSPTYVPTKIDMTIVLLPVQSRQQVSTGFTMRQFANGDLLKKGFW